MEQLTQYLTILSATEWLMTSVILVLVMSLFSIKQQRKQYKKNIHSMQSLQRDLRALTNAAVGVGGRVLEIERHQRLTPVISAVPDMDIQPEHNTYTPSTFNAPVEYYNSSSQPYEQAIRMAQGGSSVADIVNVCGLSKSEAGLVSMMHRLEEAS